MRGPYVITNSEGVVCGAGYDYWDSNEEAIQQITSKCETMKKMLNDTLSNKN